MHCETWEYLWDRNVSRSLETKKINKQNTTFPVRHLCTKKDKHGHICWRKITKIFCLVKCRNQGKKKRITRRTCFHQKKIVSALKTLRIKAARWNENSLPSVENRRFPLTPISAAACDTSQDITEQSQELHVSFIVNFNVSIVQHTAHLSKSSLIKQSSDKRLVHSLASRQNCSTVKHMQTSVYIHSYIHPENMYKELTIPMHAPSHTYTLQEFQNQW